MSRVRALLADCAGALGFGALTALGEPGIDLFPLGLLGVAGLAFLITRRGGFAHACALGLAFGAALFAVLMVGTVSWGAQVPAALTIAGALSYGAPLSLWIRASSRRLGGFVLFAASAAAWGLWLDLGDCFGLSSNWEILAAVAASPSLVFGARLVGCNTLSGIVIGAAICAGVELTHAARRQRWLRAGTALASAIAALLLLGIAARVTAAKSTGSLLVGVPQMNVPSEFFRTRQAIVEQAERFDRTFVNQLNQLRDVDLLALTEAYDGRFALQVPAQRRRFQAYARLERQALLLTSYLVAEDGGGYNAVGGIAADGALVGIHRKVNLAPFGESDLEAGPGFHALHLSPELRVGALICQESVPVMGSRALARDGANLLVVTTSDTSFGSGLVVFGHLAATQVRAIESGRDTVWASASGPSGVVTRAGEFVAGAPFRSATAARMQAELYQDTTPFLRTSWLWPLLRLGFFAWLLKRAVRGPTVTTPLPESAPRAPTWLGAISNLAAALAAVALLTLASPGLVELRRGVSSRARFAVAELFKGGPALSGASYERFRSSPARSAEGALAFYIDFYGPSQNAADVHLPRENPGFEGLLDYLRSAAFPSRQLHLNWQRLPRAATLVRYRNGEYAVLTSNGVGVASLFSPVLAAPRMLQTHDLQRLIEPVGIVPAGASDTATWAE